MIGPSCSGALEFLEGAFSGLMNTGVFVTPEG